MYAVIQTDTGRTYTGDLYGPFRTQKDAEEWVQAREEEAKRQGDRVAYTVRHLYSPE